MLVGGKVLDASAVAAWAGGGLAIQSWVVVAADLGLTLYLPSLARVEVETLWPTTTVLIEDLAAYPNVVVERMWPALSADPGRLQRIDPNLPVELL